MNSLRAVPPTLLSLILSQERAVSLLQLFQARMAATAAEDVLPPSERAGHCTGINPEPPSTPEPKWIIKQPEYIISVLYPPKSWLSLQPGADFRVRDTENGDLRRNMVHFLPERFNF